MDVLIVAGELAPFAKETPAAEAVSELSRAVSYLGHNVTIALPRHPSFERSGLLLARRLTPIELPAGGQESAANVADAAADVVTVFDSQLASGVKLVLFDSPGLYDREGVYGEQGVDYADNPRRFGLFTRAVAQLVKKRAEQGQRFGVVHLHDWAVAPLASLLAELCAADGCVLTLHGDYQRLFDQKQSAQWGVTSSQAAAAVVGGKFSPALLGLSTAHAVTVGSATYAEELRTEAVASSFAAAFRELGERLIGISEGIDYAFFNPATDTALPMRFDATEPAARRSCKAEVLRKMGLEFELERPLVLVAPEPPDSPRLELFGRAIAKLLRQPLAILMLGELEPSLAKLFDESHLGASGAFRRRSAGPEQLRAAHAGADFLLCLGRDRATARDARIGQRYGAIPIAPASGGYADAIVDIDPELSSGTGILTDLDAESLVGAFGRAAAAYQLPAFPSLQRRVMQLDRSWERPARRYLQVYRQASGL